jgi:hypothetical protein
MQFPGALHNLTKVDELPYFRDLAVQMNDEALGLDNYFAVYFLPTKRLHVVSSRFRPNEPLSLERISRQQPFLIQNYSCDEVGADETVEEPGIGCLLLAPPSLAIGTKYHFNRNLLFITMEGLDGREPWGRWNRRSSVLLKLTADPRRTEVYQDNYVNLLLSPLLTQGMRRQRLVLSWGANRHAQLSLGQREWISLPIRIADWTGTWVQTLPISIDLPDAVPHLSPDRPEGPHDESRPPAVGFEELSVDVSPSGRTIAPLAGAEPTSP